MLKLIGLVVIIVFVLSFWGGKKFNSYRKSTIFRLKRVLRKLNSPEKNLDDAVLNLKEKAVELRTKSLAIAREMKEFKSEKVKTKAGELCEKLDKKAHEFADKSKEMEQRKVTLLGEKKVLEESLYLLKMEKGFLSEDDPISGYLEIEKMINEIQDELTAIEELF